MLPLVKMPAFVGLPAGGHFGFGVVRGVLLAVSMFCLSAQEHVGYSTKCAPVIDALQMKNRTNGRITKRVCAADLIQEDVDLIF